MERFARIVIGYHGCKAGDPADFAKRLLLGDAKVEDWRTSKNRYDWLGHGIYFWEHSPARAERWAGEDGVVIGAIIQLGRCLDLTDLYWTERLGAAYDSLVRSFDEKKLELPRNTLLGFRELDCLVINHLVNSLDIPDVSGVQTIRGAIEEGAEAFPGSMLKKETHLQVAILDTNCILGVFRPN